MIDDADPPVDDGIVSESGTTPDAADDEAAPCVWRTGTALPADSQQQPSLMLLLTSPADIAAAKYPKSSGLTRRRA